MRWNKHFLPIWWRKIENTNINQNASWLLWSCWTESQAGMWTWLLGVFGCSEVLELSWDTMLSSALWASACVSVHTCACACTRARAHTHTHMQYTEHLLASLGSPAQLPTLPSISPDTNQMESKLPDAHRNQIVLGTCLIKLFERPNSRGLSAEEGVCQLCSVVRNTEPRISWLSPSQCCWAGLLGSCTNVALDNLRCSEGPGRVSWLPGHAEEPWSVIVVSLCGS